jgi:hypothetical protein
MGDVVEGNGQATGREQLTGGGQQPLPVSLGVTA